MDIALLLSGGLLVSAVHFYLVWHHRENRKYSLSEHAIIDNDSYILYVVTHIITEALFIMFSYQFFVHEHQLYIPHYLNILFVILDFIQAVLPSRGHSEKIHFTAAYFSWISYLSAGVIALFKLHVARPFMAIAILLLIPILIMFIYMHINKTKLYPYQVAIVPLFVLYMLFLVLGSS